LLYLVAMVSPLKVWTVSCSIVSIERAKQIYPLISACYIINPDYTLKKNISLQLNDNYYA